MCTLFSPRPDSGSSVVLGGLQEGAPSQEAGRAHPIPSQFPHSPTERAQPTPQIRKLAPRKRPARHPGVWCVKSHTQHPVLSGTPGRMGRAGNRGGGRLQHWGLG